MFTKHITWRIVFSWVFLGFLWLGGCSRQAPKGQEGLGNDDVEELDALSLLQHTAAKLRVGLEDRLEDAPVLAPYFKGFFEDLNTLEEAVTMCDLPEKMKQRENDTGYFTRTFSTVLEDSAIKQDQTHYTLLSTLKGGLDSTPGTKDLDGIIDGYNTAKEEDKTKFTFNGDIVTILITKSLMSLIEDLHEDSKKEINKLKENHEQASLVIASVLDMGYFTAVDKIKQVTDMPPVAQLVEDQEKTLQILEGRCQPLECEVLRKKMNIVTELVAGYHNAVQNHQKEFSYEEYEIHWS